MALDRSSCSRRGVERVRADISLPCEEDRRRRPPAAHLGRSEPCVGTGDHTARTMRPPPSRAGPGRRRQGPLPRAHTLPSGIPAARALPSPGRRALSTPARPLMALLLLVSIKQVRAAFIIISTLMISCTYFPIIEAPEASGRQFGKYKTYLNNNIQP